MDDEGQRGRPASRRGDVPRVVRSLWEDPEFERIDPANEEQAGLRRARAQGKRLGRPRVPEKVELAIRRELAKGRGIHSVAKAVGVWTGTVQRVRAELALTG